MTDWIDFKELRKHLIFEHVLRHYGVGLKVTADQHHGFCPLPGHQGKKKSPSFSANLKRGIWQCFGCGQKGNVLDFAVLMERGDPKNGIDVRRVAFQLQERFQIKERFQMTVQKSELTVAAPEGEETKQAGSSTEEEDVRVNVPLDFELKGLDETHPYLFGREFTAETITHFGLGYCSRGLLAKRIAIPLHDSEGNLVGYAGRVVDDASISEDLPKYKFPGSRKRKDVISEFRKSLLLYNANRIWPSIINGHPVTDLVVVEGFAGVWWLSQAGITNVVATMGASCSQGQGELIRLLVEEGGYVWIFTDGDHAGERCAHDIFGYVAPHRAVRWLRLWVGKQPTAFTPQELRNMFPFHDPLK
jgi:DNA primase